jgi:6-phosphogluconolactonase
LAALQIKEVLMRSHDFYVRNRYFSHLALMAFLVVLSACAGSPKTVVVCNGSSAGSCSCGTAATAACPAEDPEFLYYVGGTSSTGLQFQIFPINSSTGVLGSPAIENNVSLSGVMAVVPAGPFYYAIGSSGIDGYSVGGSGTLSPLAGSPFAANFFNPLAVAVDPLGKFLFVSDTYNANIDVFAIDASTGGLSQVPGSPFSNNTLYTNSAALTPSGNFLYVVDGGSDSGIAGLSAYSVDRTTGALTPVSGGSFTYSGYDSEYFDVAVHPNGQFLYFTETDGIHAFSINQSTGVLTPLTSAPLVALPSPMQLGFNAAGTVLYVGVGGAGTIAAYSVNSSSGALTGVAGSPYSLGYNPAPASAVDVFALDASGQFLYTLANGGQPGVMEFSVDAGSGALTQLGIVSDTSSFGIGGTWPVPFAVVKVP